MSKLSLLEFVRLDAIDLDNIILEAVGYNPDDNTWVDKNGKVIR